MLVELDYSNACLLPILFLGIHAGYAAFDMLDKWLKMILL